MKTTVIKILGLFLLIVSLPSLAKTQNQQTLSKDSLDQTTCVQKSHTKVSEEDFNQGLLIDPLQLIQARIPSLMISRSGNDPNGFFDVRNRGLKSFNKTEPLFLLDGMPISSIHGIHPNDISSMEILQDGASLAKYGIRGSNGILSIRTKRGKPGETRISYRSSFARESIVRTPQVLNARTFASRGGGDFGAKTDWWEEITRKARSQSHHLSLSGGTEQSNYYASFNFDDIHGIAKKTGFDRLTGRLSFQQKALNDRLELGVYLATTNKNKHLIPPDIFKYATQTNPTFPIRTDDPEFEQFDGYFSPALYDAYNPVGILEQIDLEERYLNVYGNTLAQFNISPALSAYAQYGQELEEASSASYVPSSSRFGSGFNQGGKATQARDKRNNQYFSSGLTFSKTFKDLYIQASGAYHYQEIERTGLGSIGTNFLTDIFRYNNMAAAASFDQGTGTVNSQKHIQELSRYTGTLDLKYKETYFIAASLSKEGASNLGTNSKWGLFYGISAGASLSDNIDLRTSFSKTGNAPVGHLLTQSIYEQVSVPFYFEGEYIRGYQKVQEANPDLQWEETEEFSVGLDFNGLLNKRLEASFDFYTSTSDQIIQMTLDRSFPYPAIRKYENSGAMSSSGLEFSINYALAKRPGFTWNLQVLGARYFNTKILAYTTNDLRYPDFVGYMGGRCDFPLLHLNVGERFGDIWGVKLNEAQPIRDGALNFEDSDGDGIQNEDNDRTSIGNAFAKTYLGIRNQMSWGTFRIDALLRGVLGHDIVNHNHSFYSFPNTLAAYNILESGLTEYRGLDWYAPVFTDRDVENASFLRLAYLTFSYDLMINSHKGIRKLNISLTAQNLFTISSYTGMNPEYRIEDRAESYQMLPLYGLGDGGGDPLVPGMDRRTSYPVSRSFVLGINIDL